MYEAKELSCVKCEHLRPEHRDDICYGERFCTCIKFEEAVEIIKNLVKLDPIQTITTNGWVDGKRHFHNYKKEYGGTQKYMIDVYLGVGKILMKFKNC